MTGRPPLTRIRKIALVAVAAVVVVFAILALTVCSPMTVVPQGTVLSILPQQYVQYGFTRPPYSEGATYGQFSADHGATLYVMTAAQFQSWSTIGSPSSFIYSTGQVNSGSLGGKYSNAYIKPPGQYYFMFYNAGSTTTSVTITNTLAVETC